MNFHDIPHLANQHRFIPVLDLHQIGVASLFELAQQAQRQLAVLGKLGFLELQMLIGHKPQCRAGQSQRHGDEDGIPVRPVLADIHDQDARVDERRRHPEDDGEYDAKFEAH